VSEGFDLAVRAGHLSDSSLVARRIGVREMALVASPSYLRRRGRPKTFDDLREHEWVLYRSAGWRSSIQLTSAKGDRTIEVTGALIVDDLAFCRTAAEGGAGIALIPITLLGESLASNKLEIVLSEWTYGPAPISVVLPTARNVPARVALLRDFLVSDVGEQLDALHARRGFRGRY
jgi:DNA-binding transcriptional LysR family regulator